MSGSSGLWVGALALLPLVVLTLTSFVKISVVLSLVRNAIGAPDAPSGLVVTGLSLVLTFFVMAPVGIQMVTAASADGVAPAGAGSAAPTPSPSPSPSASASASASASPTPPSPTPTLSQAVHVLVPAEYHRDLDAAERAAGPLRTFLAGHASARDRETFRDLAVKLGHPTPAGDELWVVAPAFVTTELREAFAIAVLVFLPFLVIDLVVGLGLSALGLQATSPQTVALPLKLLLFVAVDGWRLLIDGLLRGYA